MPEIGFLGLKYLIFFILLAFYSLNAQYPDKRVHLLLSSGIDNLINCKYPSAVKNFNQLNKEHPQLPLGDIYLAAVEIARSYDYGDNYNEDLIDSLLKSGIDKAEKLVKNTPDDKWNLYFLALAEGYSAYYKALQEKWISALSYGMNSVDLFRKCVSEDDEFYEAYTAIGTYVYWKSRKLESLNWLPFLENETEEGIRLLETASDSAVYSRYLAVNALIWIYIDQKRFDDASAAAENILSDYPGSRFFKWGLARALEETDKPGSIKVYYEILNSFNNPSVINEITLKHKIAQQYFYLGNNTAAMKLCSDILSKNYIAESSDEEVRSRLKRVRELQEELIK
jgi:predicted Zn-dependent protease